MILFTLVLLESIYLQSQVRLSEPLASNTAYTLVQCACTIAVIRPSNIRIQSDGTDVVLHWWRFHCESKLFDRVLVTIYRTFSAHLLATIPCTLMLTRRYNTWKKVQTASYRYTGPWAT